MHVHEKLLAHMHVLKQFNILLTCIVFIFMTCCPFTGASRFTYNKLGRTIYLCVAIKTRIIIYEISNSQKNKYEKKKVRSHVV